MKFSILIVALLLLAGCQKQQPIDINSLKDIPASGESGEIHYPKEVGTQKDNYAPEFEVKTIEGKLENLSELTKSKKPVLLYFFATWCPYCREDLENAQKALKGQNVTVLIVDMDLNEKAPLISKYQFDHGHASMEFAEGNEQILRAYGVTRTTTKYAISPEGIILWTGSGVANESVWSVLLDGLGK